MLLSIETASPFCSVALLLKDGRIDQIRDDKTLNHSKEMAVYVDKILSRNEVLPTDLKGVVIAQGPGSYTGLRIGTSFAKGFCYALNSPLIAVNPLQAMAASVASSHNADYFCATLDARRMDVYVAVYDKNNEEVSSVRALTVTDNFTKDIGLSSLGNVAFFGTGASKCVKALAGRDARLVEHPLAASDMIPLAMAKLEKGETEDVAYYEPAYLKSFVGTKPKKNILV